MEICNSGEKVLQDAVYAVWVNPVTK